MIFNFKILLLILLVSIFNYSSRIYSNNNIVNSKKNSSSFNSIDTLSIKKIFDQILVNKDTLNILEIDLDHFFTLIKKRSLDYKKLKLAELNLEQERDDFLYHFYPNVNLSTTIPSISSSSTQFQSNDSIYQVSTTSLSSTLSIDQNLPFNSLLTFSYLNGLSNNSSLNSNNLSKGLNFSITTPIFFGMNSFSDFDLKKRTYIMDEKRNRQNLIDFQYSSISKFINLYRVQSRFKLDKKGYELSIKNYNEAVKKYKIGIMPEVDLLDLQLNMEKSKLSFLQTSYNLDFAVKNFNLFLGLSIEKNTVLNYQKSSDLQDMTIDFEKIEDLVMSSNLEILSFKNAVLNRKNDIDNIYKSNFINASISLFYNLNDSREYLSNDYSNEFFFNFDNLDENKGFSFNINFPIFNRNIFTNSLKRNEFELKLSKDELSKKKFEVKLNLKNKYDDIKFNRENYNITNKSNILAKKIYEISIKRFENGLLTSKDLIQNQLNYQSSNQQLINSKIDLELSIYELKRFIGEELIYEWK